MQEFYLVFKITINLVVNKLMSWDIKLLLMLFVIAVQHTVNVCVINYCSLLSIHMTLLCHCWYVPMLALCRFTNNIKWGTKCPHVCMYIKKKICSLVCVLETKCITHASKMNISIDVLHRYVTFCTVIPLTQLLTMYTDVQQRPCCLHDLPSYTRKPS